MKNKYVNAIAGIIIIYLSASGQYINKGITDNIFLYGLIDTLKVSLIMLLMPAIFFFENKNFLDYEKGKKICKYNSIVLFIISILLNLTINTGIVGGVGAIIYYYINLNLFVENKNTKKFAKLNNKKTSKYSSEEKRLGFVLAIICIIIVSIVIFAYSSLLV